MGEDLGGNLQNLKLHESLEKHASNHSREMFLMMKAKK